MRKKLFTLVLTAILLLSLGGSSLALTPPTPKYSIIAGTDIYFDINASNVATCSASLQGISSTDKVTVTMKLQIYSGGTYYNVITWTDTDYDNYVSLHKTYSVQNASTYRLYVTYTAVDGSVSETITRTRTAYS